MGIFPSLFYRIKYIFSQVKRISADDQQQAQNIRAFLPDFEILFFTPQLLVNNLESGGVNLQMFTMLVFDECHHTQGETPYNIIMRMYLVEKYLKRHTFDLPQVSVIIVTFDISILTNTRT